MLTIVKLRGESHTAIWVLHTWTFIIKRFVSQAQLPNVYFLSMFTEGVLWESVVHVVIVIAQEKKKVKSKQHMFFE